MTLDPDAPAAAVTKQFKTIAGRTMLIESVEYASIQAELKALPDCGVRTASTKTFRNGSKVTSGALAIPTPRSAEQAQMAPKQTSTRMAAAVVNKRAGVVIDYIAD